MRACVHITIAARAVNVTITTREKNVPRDWLRARPSSSAPPVSQRPRTLPVVAEALPAKARSNSSVDAKKPAPSTAIPRRVVSPPRGWFHQPKRALSMRDNVSTAAARTSTRAIGAATRSTRVVQRLPASENAAMPAMVIPTAAGAPNRRSAIGRTLRTTPTRNSSHAPRDAKPAARKRAWGVPARAVAAGRSTQAHLRIRIARDGTRGGQLPLSPAGADAMGRRSSSWRRPRAHVRHVATG